MLSLSLVEFLVIFTNKKPFLFCLICVFLYKNCLKIYVNNIKLNFIEDFNKNLLTLRFIHYYNFNTAIHLILQAFLYISLYYFKKKVMLFKT